MNPVPYNAASAVEAEESLGKYTEDFGGYDLNDQKSRNSRLGYETRANENLEASSIKPRAPLNIDESTTPIRLSQ